MNIKICSSQSKLHKKTQAKTLSSDVARLSKPSDLLSLPLSSARRGGRKSGAKNRTKVERIVDDLVNCGTPNQQILTLKEVLKI